MASDDPLRDFGILPGDRHSPPGRVRSRLTWPNAVFQVVMSALLVGGFTALGVVMAVQGLRAWGRPDAFVLLPGAPLMLGLAAFLAYHGAGDAHLWVEIDGEEIRARHLYTLRVTRRRVGEIEEVRTLYFALRGDVRTAVVESFVGRVRGFEIRFPGRRRGIRVFRPEMTHVRELIEAVIAGMSRHGEVVPEVVDFEGRPLVKRVTWDGRPGEAPEDP